MNTAELGRAHARFCLVASTLVLGACCGAPTDDVIIGSPMERWDHNRTVAIEEWTYETSESPFAPPSARSVGLPVFSTEALASPYGALDERGDWSGVPPRGGRLGADGLPEAWLRPAFLGVALPLSDDETDHAESDRVDLIDFLSAGPHANAGLERLPLAGSLPEDTAARFAPILTLLSNEAMLATRESIVAWARDHGVHTSRDILDPRFLQSSFADRVALKVEGFWFVLFMPDLDPRQFSRLIVAPDRGERRDAPQGELVGGGGPP